MTATAFHVAKLQLEDFTVPAIPDCYRLKMIEITKAATDGRGRYNRIWLDDYADEASLIDAACDYIIRKVGWVNARIELVLERIGDRYEGRMAYDCDEDTWETTLADDEESVFPHAADAPAVADPDSTPTRCLHPLAVAVTDDAMPVEV